LLAGELLRFNYKWKFIELEYNAWLGPLIILQIALDDVEVLLRGRLLRERGETTRFQIGEGWDIEIYKKMILAITEEE